MNDYDFVERTVTPTGKEGRKGHYYAWGRCLVCNDVQLVSTTKSLKLRAADMGKRTCVMTPGCTGTLTPAEDVEVGSPVDRAKAAFDAEVISMPGEEEVAG